MSRTISIEDMVLPLRTYSWAVTGSVSLADALLVKCFDKLSKEPASNLPTTKTEWFRYIDKFVVDWTASKLKDQVVDHKVTINSIQQVVANRPAVLDSLLKSQIREI